MFPTFPELTLLALIAAGWRHVVVIFDRVRGIFVQRTIFRYSVANAVSDYLLSEAIILKWGEQLIESRSAWVRPENRVREVALELPPGKPMIAILHGRILIFRRPVEGGQNSDSMPVHDGNLIVTHLRGTLDISQLTRQALDWVTQRETTGSRYRVQHIGGRGNGKRSEGTDTPRSASRLQEDIRPGTRFLHWAENEIGAPRPPAPFASYALSPETEDARADFLHWIKLKQWYLDRSIPWRRGHLLYGPPGTGKTALVRALAQEADMPIFAYDLSSLSNDEFRYHWQDMQESAPCIALIEDIDGVFHGRDNVLAGNNTMRDTLTFDCLLNAMGGIQTADGIFVVVTTNRPELLDEALGKPDKPEQGGGTTRPGRLDRAFCITAPNTGQRAEIIERIVGTVDESDLAHTTGMTAAQVTEWAVTKALATQWGDLPEPVFSPLP